jgi:hypothetical protein
MTPALAEHELSDSDRTEPVTVRASPNHQSHAIGRCSRCNRLTLDDLIDGGDIGLVHRACFVAWDQHQEALELMLARSCAAPHHAEGLADLDLEPVSLELPSAAVARPTLSRSRRTTPAPPEGLNACAAP